MDRTAAQLHFRTERAANAVRGIFAVMDTGRFLTRAFFVQRFREAGYVQRMAEAKADALIAVNTDIRHWSRFDVRGTGEGTAYGWFPEQLRLRAELA